MTKKSMGWIAIRPLLFLKNVPINNKYFYYFWRNQKLTNYDLQIFIIIRRSR